ncbi:hypothetical protein F5Y19DRAFT_476192 [Xylariaceae sp. FL1651]|nr:hypothetical protein F5Y19DRAFT_476192 [Xylariaceae sp. FL1651]
MSLPSPFGEGSPTSEYVEETTRALGSLTFAEGMVSCAVTTQPEAEAQFHLFQKLPPEVKDEIWKSALFAEVKEAKTDFENPDLKNLGLPPIASACRAAREVVRRHGAWLYTTIRKKKKKPLFFIPDCTILYEGGTELTVTSEQVIQGLHPLFMRLALRSNALKRITNIYIIASEGSAQIIPLSWPRSCHGSATAELEHALNMTLPDYSEVFISLSAHKEMYSPSIEWTGRQWEEIEITITRSWMLAKWYVKDPTDVTRADIMKLDMWGDNCSNSWVRAELYKRPVFWPVYMKAKTKGN